MIQINAEKNKVYAVAEEKLTDEDYDKFIPFLQTKLKEYEKLNLYFEMKNFDGWDLSSFWRDAKFDIKNITNFKKVAMVGSKKWEDFMTQLMKPFTSAEVKFFEENEKEKAKQFIEN